MALVTEDGSQKSDAEAYITVAELKAYAEARDVSLTTINDTALEQMIRKTTAYIEARRSRFQGAKATDAQALEWPRAWVEVSGYAVASDAIPQEMKDAQCELALLVDSGEDIYPNITTSGRETGITVGPIRVDYDEGSQPRQPIWRKVEDLLRPLYNTGGLTMTRR
jgi:hypothetical protein